MSLSLSSPAASMTRNAITSVALPGEPVDTRLPLRSVILSMPVPSTDHHVHAVGIEHRERAHVDLVALELVLALEGVERGVDHGEGDLRLARADQLQVIDRAARHFGARLHAGQGLRQDVRQAAAERVVDAAGAPGRDRDVALLRVGGRRNCRSHQRDAAPDPLSAEHSYPPDNPRAAYTVGGQSIHVTTEDKPVLRLIARRAGPLGCAAEADIRLASRDQGRGNPTYATSPLIGATMALSGNTLAANAFSSTRR